MFLLFKCVVLFVGLMIGFLFISGAGVTPVFFIYTPPVELSRLVVIISSLLSFVALSQKIIRYVAKKRSIHNKER